MWRQRWFSEPVSYALWNVSISLLCVTELLPYMALFVCACVCASLHVLRCIMYAWSRACEYICVGPSVTVCKCVHLCVCVCSLLHDWVWYMCRYEAMSVYPCVWMPLKWVRYSCYSSIRFTTFLDCFCSMNSCKGHWTPLIYCPETMVPMLVILKERHWASVVSNLKNNCSSHCVCVHFCLTVCVCVCYCLSLCVCCCVFVYIHVHRFRGWFVIFLYSVFWGIVCCSWPCKECTLW